MKFAGTMEINVTLNILSQKNPSDFKINGSKIIGEPIDKVTEME